MMIIINIAHAYILFDVTHQTARGGSISTMRINGALCPVSLCHNLQKKRYNGESAKLEKPPGTWA